MKKYSRIFKKIKSLFLLFFLCASLIVPQSLRKKIMRYCASCSFDIVLRLLFPALAREKRTDPRWVRPFKPASKDLIIAIGGNNETQDELVLLLDGLRLYDHERFEKSNKPVLMFPLLRAYSEKEYVEKFVYLLKQELSKIQIECLENIQIIGHSLGGAISLQITSSVMEIAPQARIHLLLDRTFSSLKETAKSLYGPFGSLLERTLGLLWIFDSIEALKRLVPYPQVQVTIIQVKPDHVLGRALLSEKVRHFPREDWSLYFLEREPHNRLHAAPFKALRIPSFQ